MYCGSGANGWTADLLRADDCTPQFLTFLSSVPAIPHQPLTETEFEHLDTFLAECKGGKAMNIEELDGFLAALVVGPDLVMPSEYYPHVFGGSLEHTCNFETIDEANAILGLMMRHWNTIAATLNAGDVYVPVLLENAQGVAEANGWAHGFMRGVELRREQWAGLFDDEEHGGSILPMLMLYHEHDPDPELRPNPISAEQREEIIRDMAAGLVHIHRYYREQRSGGSAGGRHARTLRRETPKVGRNDPCPCGSGKKYKHCHGGTTLH